MHAPRRAAVIARHCACPVRDQNRPAPAGSRHAGALARSGQTGAPTSGRSDRRRTGARTRAALPPRRTVPNRRLGLRVARGTAGRSRRPGYGPAEPGRGPGGGAAYSCWPDGGPEYCGGVGGRARGPSSGRSSSPSGGSYESRACALAVSASRSDARISASGCSRAGGSFESNQSLGVERLVRRRRLAAGRLRRLGQPGRRRPRRPRRRPARPAPPAPWRTRSARSTPCSRRPARSAAASAGIGRRAASGPGRTAWIDANTVSIALAWPCAAR